VPKRLEMEDVHFFQGLFRRPVFKGDPVSSKKNARAITAKPTMDENNVFWDDGQ
jgi:hypothetical protein